MTHRTALLAVFKRCFREGCRHNENQPRELQRCIYCGSPRGQRISIDALLKEHLPGTELMVLERAATVARPEACDECGTELHPFDGPNGESGKSCDTCGWSWDD